MAVKHLAATAIAGLAVTGFAGAMVLQQGIVPSPVGAAAMAHAAHDPDEVAARAGNAVADDDVAPEGSVPVQAVTGVQSIVALGDSVPAGTGSDATPFPDLLRRSLEPTNPGVRLTNLGVAGETAADIADSLHNDPGMIAAVRFADVVLVTAGANDLNPAYNTAAASGCDEACTTDAVQTAAASVSSIVGQVAAIDTRPGRRILVTTYWNAFTDGDVARSEENAALRQWTDTVTRKANAAFCRAAADAKATCVDTYAPFKGGDGSKNPTSLLAPDGDHPSQQGHRAIAQALLRALATH